MVAGAGPPGIQTAVALGVGVVLGVAVTIGTGAHSNVAIVLIPAAATAVVAIVDRVGWRIRTMLYGLALEQRQRRPELASIQSTTAADEWLADPANDAAEPLERASVLIAARRDADAAALLRSIEPSTDADRSSLVRLTAFVEGRSSGVMDVDKVRMASAPLSSDDQRYQIVGAAISQAVFDIEHGRPWRRRLADTTADQAPYRLPRRFLLLVGVQEFAMPIAIGIAGAIALLF